MTTKKLESLSLKVHFNNLYDLLSDYDIEKCHSVIAECVKSAEIALADILNGKMEGDQ